MRNVPARRLEHGKGRPCGFGSRGAWYRPIGATSCYGDLRSDGRNEGTVLAQPAERRLSLLSPTIQPHSAPVAHLPCNGLQRGGVFGIGRRAIRRCR